MKAPEYGASRAAPSYEPPKYAQYDARSGTEDSLPSMPTWDQGGSRKVALEEEAVEMNALNRPENNGQSVASASAAAAASAAAVAAAAGASSPERRPIPYRHASPMTGGAPASYASQDPYASYGGYDNNPYGHDATQSGGNQYGAVAAVPSDLRKPSPRPENGYDGQPGYDMPKEPDYNQTADPYYAPGARQPSPASHAHAMGRTGHTSVPPAADFGQVPQRYGSPAGVRGVHAEDPSSTGNNGGFDFNNTGYSRSPPTQPFAYDSPYDRRGSPAQQLAPTNTGYNAYAPYSPQQLQQQPQQRW
ncbi:hypothetical protein IMZ48_46650 [Candidatus Bathyarchaeota archaeon]|nr:hypothetical protein [Candidatus Bathyarchaeota archaeon]